MRRQPSRVVEIPPSTGSVMPWMRAAAAEASQATAWATSSGWTVRPAGVPAVIWSRRLPTTGWPGAPRRLHRATTFDQDDHHESRLLEAATPGFTPVVDTLAYPTRGWEQSRPRDESANARVGAPGTGRDAQFLDLARHHTTRYMTTATSLRFGAWCAFVRHRAPGCAAAAASPR